MVMAAALVIVMMMVMLMLLVVMAAAVAVIVMMMVMPMLLVVMAAAVTVIVMMMVMLMLLVVVAAAVAVIVMMMVMLMLLFLQPLCLHPGKLCGKGSFALHGGNQLIAGELVPGRCDDCRHLIVPAKHLNGGIQLGLGNGIGTGQNNGGRCLDLIVVEFAEVLGIDLHLTGIHHRHSIAQAHILASHLVHSADDVRQLAYTGGLNDDPVRRVLRNDLFQRFSEITHQRTADTAGVHLRNVDTGILQKTTVNTDLTKLVFDQHQLLALVAFGNHLLNQRCFSRAEKAGVNVNLCHKTKHLLIHNICSLEAHGFCRAFFIHGEYSTFQIKNP